MIGVIEDYSLVSFSILDIKVSISKCLTDNDNM